MAARRRISFSCSKRRTRFLYSSSSLASASLRPGRTPSSMSSFFEPGVQGCFGDPEVLGHLADRCFPFTGHGDNVTVELGGKGFGHGAHPSCEWILVRLGDNQTLGSPSGGTNARSVGEAM